MTKRMSKQASGIVEKGKSLPELQVCKYFLHLCEEGCRNMYENIVQALVCSAKLVIQPM